MTCPPDDIALHAPTPRPEGPLAPTQRRALRAEVDRAGAELRKLPQAQQRRLYEQSRAASPTLFALLQRLREDPALRPLVQAAVERTRLAPSQAELGRALKRAYAGALRADGMAFRPAAAIVLQRLREEFGQDNTRRVKLSDLQRGYLAAAARVHGGGCEAAASVMALSTVSELWDGVAVAQQDGQRDMPEVAADKHPSMAGSVAPRAGIAIGESLLATGVLAACLHIEAGVRGFPDFAEAMAADLGDAVRPYLRMFYEAIRHCPGFDMSDKKAAAAGGDLLFA